MVKSCRLRSVLSQIRLKVPTRKPASHTIRALARKLMQIDKPLAILALAGRAMTDLARVERALLPVRGEVDESIDGLKLVNDQLGHATGDQLIRDAAGVLRESLRDTNILARFGGDEFAAFALDNVHPRVILARLRENLHAFNLVQELSYRLAISAGAVHCAPGNGTPLVDYVQLADKEMYLHKQRSLH